MISSADLPVATIRINEMVLEYQRLRRAIQRVVEFTRFAAGPDPHRSADPGVPTGPSIITDRITHTFEHSPLIGVFLQEQN